MEAFFQACGEDIVSRLIEPNLSVRLYARGVLTPLELEEVSNMETTIHRRRLLNILMTKSLAAIRAFVDIVRDATTGQEDLVEKLEAEIQKWVVSAKRCGVNLDGHHLQGAKIAKQQQESRAACVGVWLGVNEVVHNFTGREEELGTLHRLVTDNHDEGTYSVLTSVHGLGGIGKTSLARKYAWRQRAFYENNVVWIDCERGELIREAFIRVARRLQLQVVGEDEEGDRELCTAVYEWFDQNTTACLFIFDNVEDFSGPDGVRAWLPVNLAPHIRRPHLLLTSRRSDLVRHGKVLRLDVLSWEDAVELVRKSLPDTSTDSVETFVRKLGRLPLALQQALAYLDEVKDTMSGDQDNVLHAYMELYEQRAQELLSDTKFMEHFLSDSEYKKSVYLTWRVTLDKIETLEFGVLAIRTLQQLAFFNSDSIQLDYFSRLGSARAVDLLQFLKPDMQQLLGVSWSVAVGILSKFSMVNCVHGVVSMHRLVQEVVRLDIGAEDEVELVGNVVRLTTAHLPRTEFGEQTLLHATSVLPFYFRNKAVMEEFPEFGSQVSEHSQLIRHSVSQLPRETEANCVRLLDVMNMDSGCVQMAVAYVRRAAAANRTKSCRLDVYIKGAVVCKELRLRHLTYPAVDDEVRTMLGCWTDSFLAHLQSLEDPEFLLELCCILCHLSHEHITADWVSNALGVTEERVDRALVRLEEVSLVSRSKEEDWRMDLVAHMSLQQLPASVTPVSVQRSLQRLVRHVEQGLAMSDGRELECATHGFFLSSHIFNGGSGHRAVDFECEASFIVNVHWHLLSLRRSPDAFHLSAEARRSTKFQMSGDCGELMVCRESVYKALFGRHEETNDGGSTRVWEQGLAACERLIDLHNSTAPGGCVQESKELVHALRHKSLLLEKLGQMEESKALFTESFNMGTRIRARGDGTKANAPLAHATPHFLPETIINALDSVFPRSEDMRFPPRFNVSNINFTVTSGQGQDPADQSESTLPDSGVR